MERTKFKNISSAKRVLLHLRSLNDIMEEYESGTVQVQSHKAQYVFTPYVYDQRGNSWLGTFLHRHRRYYLRWRRGDNPLYKIRDTCEPLPLNHPARQQIEAVRTILKEGMEPGPRNTCFDGFKFEAYI